MEKVINGSKLQLALADYLATNAYINDTAQDIGKAVIIVLWFAFLYFCFHMEDLL